MGTIRRYKGFRSLWIGQLFSQFGNAVFSIMALWEIQLHQPQLLAVAGLAMVLPSLLAAFGGVVVDRHHPGRLMLWTDLLRGVAVALGLGALLIPGSLDAVTIALIAVNSLGAAFFGPAEMVVVPRLVSAQDLAGANGVYNLTYQLSNAIGAAIGGAAIAAIGVIWVFGFDMASFWISAAAILLMLRTFTWEPPVAPVEREPAERSGFLTSLGTGWATLRDLPGITRMMPVVVLTNFAYMAAFTMLPYWIHHELHAGAAAYGLIDAGWATGLIVGGLLTTRFQRWPLRTSSSLMFGAQSLLLLAFPFATQSWLAGGLLLVAGIGNGIGNALMFTMLQQLTPEDVRGRAFGLLFTLFGIANPLGSLAAGVALGRIPLIVSWLVAGFTGIWLAASIWRSVPADLGISQPTGEPEAV